MRKPSTDLFVLIKSMSPDEKRFFKLYSRQIRKGKKVVNLALFDLIDQQEEYDEAAVKAAFSGQLKANQFAVAKNYLYNSILKALAHYLGDREGKMKIRQQLRMLEVLFQKELLDQCEKVLQRVEGMVAQNTYPMLILEVQEWRMRLWNKRYFRGVSAKDMENMRDLANLNLRRLEHAALSCLANYDFLFLMRTQGYLHSSEEAQALFSKVMADPVLQVTGELDTPNSRLAQLYTQGLYAMITGNTAESQQHFKELVDLLDVAADVAYDYFDFYITVQYNYGTVSLLMHDNVAVGRTIQKIDRVKAAFAAQKARVFYCSYLLNIEYLLGGLKFDEAARLNEEARINLAQYRNQLSSTERVSLCFTIAFLYFSHADYLATHRLLQEEMDAQILTDLPDLQVVVLMLQVILYYEMEEFELFTQHCRKLYRFLLQRKPRFQLESLVLKAVRKSSSLKSAQDLRNFYIGFRAELETLRADPKEGRTLQYFNFVVWLDSKIMRIPITEVIRRQVTTQQSAV